MLYGASTGLYCSGYTYGGWYYSSSTGLWSSAPSYGAFIYSGSTGIYSSGYSYGHYSYSSYTGLYSYGGSYGVFACGGSYAFYGYGGSYGAYVYSGSTGIYTSGLYYGLYAYNSSYDTIYAYRYGYPVSGSGYGTSGYAGVKGYTFYGMTYNFGVIGQSYGDYYRTGGVHGYVGGAWAGCGYKDSAGTYYALYYSGSVGAGSGKDDSAVVGIGLGGCGGVLGAHISGEVMGLYTKGNMYANYAYGDTYATGVMATIQDTGDIRTAYYGVTSPDVEVITHGVGTMEKSLAEVSFDKDFLNTVSKESPIVVTVSPKGLCDQLCITEQNDAGFSVEEANAGKSDVEFNWIAIGIRSGYETRPVLDHNLASIDFDNHMLQVAADEDDTDIVRSSVWYDGENLQWTEYKIDLGPKVEPVQSQPEVVFEPPANIPPAESDAVEHVPSVNDVPEVHAPLFDANAGAPGTSTLTTPTNG
jgi:hypothetical protein